MNNEKNKKTISASKCLLSMVCMGIAWFALSFAYVKSTETDIEPSSSYVGVMTALYIVAMIAVSAWTKNIVKTHDEQKSTPINSLKHKRVEGYYVGDTYMERIVDDDE